MLGFQRVAEGLEESKSDHRSAIHYSSYIWLSASHDLRLGMDGMLLALCDHGFERSG